MKIAIITDTHWGIRNDSLVMHDYMKAFLDDIFFPTLKERGIDTLLHLGDLVDRRKYINYVTAKRLRDDFLIPLRENNINTHIIAGNHDTFYKNTNEVNALVELVQGKYDNIKIWDKDPIDINFDGTSIMLMPWICSDNKEQSLNAIYTSKSPIVMGHFELSGFEMYRGQMNDHGDDPKLFDRFDVVCSGHYHHKSSSGNIHYLGAPCEYTWSDYGDVKGFHILDTETRELEFIQNPHTMFMKHFYDDLNKQMDEVLVMDDQQFKNKYVKVIVKNKTNPIWFDMIIDRMEKIGVSDLQVVEDHFHLDLEEDSDIVNEAEDTMTILRKYLNGLSINTDKKRVENIVQSLYTEAQSIE
jgi:DNA repair exonuclease SbcCD nuclease subunit